MLALLLFQLLRLVQPQQTWTPTMPDIVVVFGDDIGARTVDLLRASGKMPNYDAFCAQGTEFVNGYAQPMCAPSRWSIMQGEWLGQNAGFGCHPNTDGTGPGPQSGTLPHGVDSLPKAMEAAGYHTAYFGRWGLGTWPGDDGGNHDYAMTPLLWGFETWRAGIPDGSEACGGSGYSDWLRVDDGEVTYSTEYHTIAVREAFIDWWENTPSPRFAFVATQAAHDPFHWPPSAAMPGGWMQPSPPNTTRQMYEAVVQSFDHAFGLMLAEIDLEETFVLVLADNGDPQAVPPSGYGASKVKFSTFNGGVRVPFAAAGLGFPEDEVSTQPVSEVDVIATLTDLAGMCFPVPSNDGQSFLPAMDGLALGREWVYVQAGENGHKAVIEEQWKLREVPGGAQFLYDLFTDPFESSPIDPDAIGYESITARLRAALAEAQS